MASSRTTHGDLFADIAAARSKQRDQELHQPEPVVKEKRILPMSASPRDAAFTPRTLMSTSQQLRTALRKQRAHYEKFTRDLTPKPKRTRTRLALTEADWRIETAQDRTSLSRVFAGKGRWEKVPLPHYGEPLGRAAAYYRMSFTLSESMLKHESLYICFKAVDYKAHVFCNGAYLGSHEGFFAPFEFEFKHCARKGKNTLVVKVENDGTILSNTGDKIYAATGLGYDDPQRGWHHCPPGMGVYQDVYVEARSGLWIGDIFIRPLVNEKKAEAWIEVWNASGDSRHPAISLSVFGQNFKATVCENKPLPLDEELRLDRSFLRFTFDMPRFRWWCPDTPWLYQARIALRSETGKLLDLQSRQFGMRSFSLDETGAPKGRLYFNGGEIRLRGANTMGHLQQCVFKKDWAQLRDDILLAKICHITFFRLTQRPVQPEIYDFCDRLGMMTQTDLPLFGNLRTNQFCEAVRQAEEMERLVRSHPCNIMVSYINEPFPLEHGNFKKYRSLSRPQLESFFTAADQAVRLWNPDRVIKAVDGDYDPPGPGISDTHCYNCWYNGHGLELGRMHKGYWQHVKPGWMYGCGEFGAEGLDPLTIMRRYYPAEWLPQSAEEEADWNPDRIIQAQTGRFHYVWYDTQHSLRGWIRASRQHQAWAVGLQTEAFRRDPRMNTFAVHLFIDAFPSGWMKAIMDVHRQPKPAFFVYREALTPLMVSLRADRFACFGGEALAMDAWVCNDLPERRDGHEIRYSLEIDGAIVCAGKHPANIPACAPAYQGTICFPVPKVGKRTAGIARLALVDRNGTVLHDSSVTIAIFSAITRSKKTVYAPGSKGGAASILARELGLRCITTGSIPEGATILFDNPNVLKRDVQRIRNAVRNGAVAIALELPTGHHLLGAAKVTIEPCGMNPINFLSRDTGHRLVRDFEPEDFKWWYDAKADRPRTILERHIAESVSWTPILKSGNGWWRNPWRPTLAAAERREGAGLWRVCQAELAGRITGNPVAEIFARRLLNVL